MTFEGISHLILYLDVNRFSRSFTFFFFILFITFCLKIIDFVVKMNGKNNKKINFYFSLSFEVEQGFVND